MRVGRAVWMMLWVGWAVPCVAATKVEYCGGKIFAVDFPTTVVQGNGLTSRIDYYVSLDNVTQRRVKISAKFRYTKGAAIHMANQLTVEKVLPPAGLEKLLLGSQIVNNPIGRGRVDESVIKESLALFCER